MLSPVRIHGSCQRLQEKLRDKAYQKKVGFAILDFDPDVVKLRSVLDFKLDLRRTRRAEQKYGQKDFDHRRVKMVPPARFQRATSRLGGERSMQLSYGSTGDES
jgi:hypothetical protein